MSLSICMAHGSLLPEGLYWYPAPFFPSLFSKEKVWNLSFSSSSLLFDIPTAIWFFSADVWHRNRMHRGLLSALTTLCDWAPSLISRCSRGDTPRLSMAPSLELRAWHFDSSLQFHAHHHHCRHLLPLSCLKQGNSSKSHCEQQQGFLFSLGIIPLCLLS